MSSNIKRKLKVILPIIFSIIVVASIVIVILLINKVTAKDYFNALNNSNYTKQVQTTTMTENNQIVYEKVETILIEGEKIYHKIEEKQLDSGLVQQYEITITEFYYSSNKIYYFENNEWKMQDFEVSKHLKYYNLRTEYFENIRFDKKVKVEGNLSGDIKDSYAGSVLTDQANLKNVSVLMTVDKDFNIQKFNIQAKTVNDRDVTIKNVFTYNYESVNLPI